MAYKLRLPDGLMLEVDSPDELRTALAIVRRSERGRQAPAPNPPVNQAPLVPAPPVDVSLLRRFLRATPDRQRTVLNSLFQASQGLTDEELCAVLGIQGNAALGGTMAGLAKNARKLHFGIEHVLTKTQSHNGAGRHYHYAMTEQMKSAMPGH